MEETLAIPKMAEIDLINDHWIRPRIYINNENNPKNFAIGWVKLAPKKKLNKFLIII